ncbi:hypothetical protein [Flavobacterium suncheonense]|uniref:Uncharacterized protein n=1 Tax=Flavobacterium suncheonense GH29-5 = DSM 17707 TaxID=1121899 RepID=A0A0A2MN87_9FLAO|nr:hypothetical protein [Flavobacterium suncheonense]KGO89730.1 hypothetical protein Q764_05915 [Flavobacterium suncheonense GH29-5 = DSM 17707]
MNLIDFTKTGGYRFKQFTLRKMQEAYFHILKAFVSFCNVPDTGNYIISGCTISGTNITSGYMYIDGELCRFEETPGDLTTKIKKDIAIENLAFKNGSNQPVFRYTSAVVHETEGTALSSFTRVYPVFDANYVHTDNNFTAALLAKLMGIETGAQKNVQTDWDVENPLSDAYLKNKPIIPNILASKTANLGAYPSNTTAVITFPDVGTSDYKVLIEIESFNPIGSRGQDIMAYATAAKTSSSFEFMGIAFDNTGVRNIKLHYILIKN